MKKKSKTGRKRDMNKFFKAWQKEFPNFYTPKVKKVLQKKDYVVSVSAGHGPYEAKPTYATTPFKFVGGRLKPVYKNGMGAKVKGFKRLKGGRMFKKEVQARAYAKKLLRSL